MTALLVLVLAFGYAVPYIALFVLIYNKFLAKMHESVLKKLIALSSLPSGVVAGLLLSLGTVDTLSAQPATFVLVMLPALLLCGRAMAMEAANARIAKAHGTYRTLRPKPECINARHFSPARRLLLFLLAPVNSVARLRLYEATVPVKNLPDSFAGYRIAHLTDVHVHPTLTWEWYEHLVATTRELKPDVILFGGDFISKPQYVNLTEKFVRMLQADDGVLFVRGNHDFWKGTHRTKRLAEASGMMLLSNQGAVIHRGNEELAIVGFEDPYVSPSRSEIQSWRKLPVARVGLVHDPVAFQTAKRAGCSVALAGHTHGGQVRLPLVGTTISGTVASKKFSCGVSKLGSMLTITSNGQGAFFPLRFLCPPEIVLLKLERASSPTS